MEMWGDPHFFITGSMTEETLKNILENAIEQSNVRFVDLVLRGNRGGAVLEVFVDTERGVSADELAEVSRSLGDVLEAQDLVKGRYTLIVSSPGLDRPVRFPWQYTRHIGHSVEAIVVRDGSEMEISGIIEENDAQVLTVVQGGARTEIPHDTIKEARIVATL